MALIGIKKLSSCILMNCSLLCQMLNLHMQQIKQKEQMFLIKFNFKLYNYQILFLYFMTDNYLEKLKQIRQKYGCQNAFSSQTIKIVDKSIQPNQQFLSIRKRSAVFERPSSSTKNVGFSKGNPEKTKVSDIYSKYTNNYDYFNNGSSIKQKQQPLIQRNRFNSTISSNQDKKYNFNYNNQNMQHQTLKLFRQNQIRKDGLKLNNYVKGVVSSKTVSPLRQKNTIQSKYGTPNNWSINNLDRVQDKIQAYLRK